MTEVPSTQAPPPLARLPLLLILALVFLVAIWETAAGVYHSLRAPQAADLQALSQAVRAELSADDLIATAPAWIDPMVRSVLGDRMPIAMLGRPDGRRYARIFEISLRGAVSEDTQGLTPDWQRRFGAYSLRLFRQRPVAVSFDAVARYADAKILQFVHDPRRPLAAQSADSLPDGAPSTPCFFAGPSPATCPPPRGPAGAFVCPQGRVERRTLEIAYRPRFGLAVSLGSGQVTQLVWDAIPDSAWQGGRLHLWLGLHDYHARKNAVGPAQVVVDVDGGQAQQTLTVDPRASEQGLVHVEIALPTGRAPSADPSAEPASHSLRLRLFADSAAHHHVGLLAEIRR